MCQPKQFFKFYTAVLFKVDPPVRKIMLFFSDNNYFIRIFAISHFLIGKIQSLPWHYGGHDYKPETKTAETQIDENYSSNSDNSIYFISTNFKVGAPQIINYLLNDENSNSQTESYYYKLFNHGCWCSKLNPENSDNLTLGGPTAIDDLDKICKNWFQARRCIELDGGSCREYKSAIGYGNNYSIRANDGCTSSNTGNALSENCIDDICQIDYYYATEIKRFVSAVDSVYFDEIRENKANDECGIFRVAPSLVRYCEGEVPEKLKIVSH